MNKPSRDVVLNVAGECGIPPMEITSNTPVVYPTIEGLERFAAAMYAAGAADMKERAAGVCHQLTAGGFSTEDEMESVVRTLGVANTAIRSLPIAPTNAEGEQG